MVVEVVRADEVLAGEDPVVIKIDVEGEERGVLEGAGAYWRNRRFWASLWKPSDHSIFSNQIWPPRKQFFGVWIAADGLRSMETELRPLLDPWEGGQNSIYVRDAAQYPRIRLKAAEPIKAIGRRDLNAEYSTNDRRP